MSDSFLIEPSISCVDGRLVRAFEAIPTPILSDVMARLPGAVGLRPYHGTKAVVGTALTVRARSGDNLLLHHALDIAEPGHMIVVDGGGDLGRALIGEIMVSYAKRRGLAGFVIDGAVRDVDALSRLDFPCFARGHTHRGPYKDGPGQINVTVSVAGMVVNPGDIVVGDADGVVAIPRDDAQSVIERALTKMSAEAAQLAAIEAGTIDRSWVLKAIRERSQSA
ncbi:RraA family protein [Paraburkholderia sp. MM5496-R1]|uniref:RraA family protein n=1 Tax=Paraburkholderia sp. MM5496-R1 TaxID=2991065 RepID=UPI003D1D6A33